MIRGPDFYREYIAQRLEDYAAKRITLKRLILDLETSGPLARFSEEIFERFFEATWGLEQIQADSLFTGNPLDTPLYRESIERDLAEIRRLLQEEE